MDKTGRIAGMPSYTELMRGFEFGPWQVLPERGLVRQGPEESHVEPLVMDVFVVLASHGGDVVTKDQLIEAVWGGRPQTDDVITRCISALRRVLKDDARNPVFIETVQRRGYRVMQPVMLLDQRVGSSTTRPSPSIRTDVLLVAVGLATVIAIGWFVLSGRGGPVADGDLASVAVFPFECLQDADDRSAHLCFGFAEQAITALNQVGNLQVVRKRDSYDGRERVVEDSVVTGSVQVIGDDVRVTARLEVVETGVVLWSAPFDDDRKGIFDLQLRVADALRGALDDDFVAVDPAAAAPENFAAAEAYALGRYLFEQRNHDRIGDAVEQFREAIRLDPSFGPAWRGLAYTYSIWPDYDLRIDRWSSFDKALEVIAEGVANDPGIRESAGTVYGYVYHKQNRWADAMANTLMAVNGPSPNADDYHWHSRVLASVGRLDESLDYARRGVAADPEYPVIISRMAIASFWVNDLATAARYFDIANRMELEASIHSLAYSLFLIRTGRFEEAKESAEKALEEIDVPSEWVGPVFDGIANPAERDAALALLARLDTSGETPANVIMTLSMLLGDVDRAMRVAGGLVTGESVFEIEIIYTDEFRAFRQHPGFEAFVRDVGLARYWESAGCEFENDRVTCGT